MFDSFLKCHLAVLRLDGTTAIRHACSNKPLSNPTVMSQVGILNGFRNLVKKLGEAQSTKNSIQSVNRFQNLCMEIVV